MSECLQSQDAVAGPHGVGGGHALQGRRPGLDDEVVEGELEGRRAVPAPGCRGIGVLAHLEERVDADVGRQIEVRDRLLGLDQPRGNGRAHVVERHLLVGARLVERLDPIGRAAVDAPRGLRGPRHPQVAGEDAPVRPGALHGRKIDTALHRQAPGQRRHGDVAAPGRAVVAGGRAHLEEGIERNRDGTAGGWRRHGGRGSGGRAGCSTRGGGDAGTAVAVRTPAASAMTATTVPTGTTSPTPARISASTPAAIASHLHRGLVGLDLEQAVAAASRPRRAT